MISMIFVSINWAAAISFHCSFTHTHTRTLSISLSFSPLRSPFCGVRYVILVWTWLCTAQTNAEQTNVAVLLSMQKHCKAAYEERRRMGEERRRAHFTFYDKILTNKNTRHTSSSHSKHEKHAMGFAYILVHCIQPIAKMSLSHTLCFFVCIVDLIQCLNFATVCCDVLHRHRKKSRTKNERKIVAFAKGQRRRFTFD